MSDTATAPRARRARLNPRGAATLPGPDDHDAPHIEAVRLSDVRREPVRWIWPHRIPLGKLTIIAGEPNQGKSLVTIDIAARITRGTAWPDLPNHNAPLGSVLLLAGEDGLSDTVGPRADAAGADSKQIIVLTQLSHVQVEGEPRVLSAIDLERDIPRIEWWIRKLGNVRALVVDPIAGYLKGDNAANKESTVRPVLQALASLAEKHEIAVIGVMHLRKAEAEAALNRLAGSVAFSAVPRAVWMIKKLGHGTPDARIMLSAKMNIARPAPGLAYRTVEPGRIEWGEEPVDMDANEAFAPEPRRGRGPGREKQRAMEFLRETLTPGLKLEREEVFRLAKEAGITEVTLNRASREVGVVKSNDDKPGNPFRWWIPEVDQEGEGGPNP